MRKYFFLLVFIATCQINPTCYAFDVLAAKLTLSSEEETIKSLTKNVFDKTGYTLIFPDNFYSMKIIGNFSNISLKALLSNVLNGINYSLEINEKKALVFVHLFKNPSDPAMAGEEGSPSANAYYAELVRIAQENENRYQAFRNNPDSIDPLSGLSFKEAKKRADSAELKIKEFVNNDSSIDPFSGELIKKVKNISAENSKKTDDFLAGPDSIDPVTGKNIQELRKTALRQQLELDQHPIKIK